MNLWQKFGSGLLIIPVLMFGLGTGIARAQQSPARSNLETRMEALERRLDQLEKRVNEVLPASGTSSEGAPADRIAALDEKLQLLEKSREEQEKKAKDSPNVSLGRGGFVVTSADKSYRFKVGGYGQLDGKTFYDDRRDQLSSSFTLRRARLNFDGTVGKFIDYRLAPEFGNGSVSLFDAYADLKYQPYAVLRGGKFKSPFGLEWLANDTELTFIERSLVSDLVPYRDVGLQLSGNLAGRLTYQAAVLNGSADGATLDRDTNKGKDTVVRLFATPFAKSSPQVLNGLGFGIGVSSGRQNGSASSPGLPSFKSTGGQATFFSYGSGSGATAVVPYAAGHRVRYSPQFYYYNGPFGFLAEYVESNQMVAAAVGNDTITKELSNHAWQVAGSWVLTGEKKSYRGVVPKRDLEHNKNGMGFGAWEIAARYNELNVDPTAFIAKLADPTKSAEAARAWAVGLNWYMNRNVKLSLDYEQTRFEKGAVVGNRPTEKGFLQRLQFVF